jgi:hypothetical protein
LPSASNTFHDPAVGRKLADYTVCSTAIDVAFAINDDTFWTFEPSGGNRYLIDVKLLVCHRGKSSADARSAHVFRTVSVSLSTRIVRRFAHSVNGAISSGP